MADRNPSPHRVADLTRRLTTHADTTARAILVRQPGDPIDLPPRGPTTRTRAIPRPTEMRSVAWTDAQLADTRRLTHLLTGHERLPVLGAAQILERLGGTIDGHDLDQLTTDATGPDADPTTVRWRINLRHIALAWHEAAEAIHDGWTALHTARWTTDQRGTTVLDQTAEAAALDLLQPLDKLERQLHALVRRVTPANIRLCGCGCRRPLDRDATRPTRDDCRQRASRARRAADG